MNHMREHMLDMDPAKCEVLGLNLYYWYLKTIYSKHIEAKEKQK